MVTFLTDCGENQIHAKLVRCCKPIYFTIFVAGVADVFAWWWYASSCRSNYFHVLVHTKYMIIVTSLFFYLHIHDCYILFCLISSVYMFYHHDLCKNEISEVINNKFHCN